MPGHHADQDAGLFAPVRVGTEVEALTTDRAWLQAMLDVEVALVRSQSRLGTVPPAAVRVIAGVAVADGFDLRELAEAARAAANPVVALVDRLTAAVAAADATAADYVHRGSTSQDILDTALMVVAARCLRVICADLDRVAAAAARLAEDHRDTPMAGRTLSQHAVPITFGLKAAGWCRAAQRAATRLRQVAADDLPVQLGGAAGTLAGYLAYAPADTDPAAYTARLLQTFAAEVGRPAPVLPWHTDRTSVAQLGFALAAATGALGKIAVDVRNLSRTEIGELAEPGGAGHGSSSAMPQKRNPVLSALTVAAATQTPSLAATLAQAMLADDERPAGAWHAEWQPLRDCLRLTGGAAHATAELVAGLRVHPERMRANLARTDGLIVAERVAAALTPLLGRADAKRVVARACAAAATGRPLADELAAAPELAAPDRAGPDRAGPDRAGPNRAGPDRAGPDRAGRVTADDVRALLDPTRYLGAAGALVDRALAAHREGSDADGV